MNVHKHGYMWIKFNFYQLNFMIISNLFITSLQEYVLKDIINQIKELAFNAKNSIHEL